MFFSSNAVGLLCLLLAVNSAAGDKFSDAGLVPVTSLDQLWRFQVGPTGVDHGVTPGDNYICLRDWKRNFLRETADGPYHDVMDCGKDGRFTVKFLGNNLASIQDSYGVYLACDKPKAGVWYLLDDSSKFMLYISQGERRLHVYNPYYDSEFEAVQPGPLLSCISIMPHLAAGFSGWKTGPKDSWTATDEWIVVGTFDNKKSKSTATLSYSKTVGVEQLPTIETGAGTAVPVEAGISFGKFFSSKVSTTAGVDWSRESSATWSEATTTRDSIEVPPGVATVIYQAVGSYGVFIIKSNYFRAEDFDSEGNVLNQWLVTVLT